MSDTWRDLFNLEMGWSQKIQNPDSDLNTLEFKDILNKGFKPFYINNQITDFGLGLDYKHPKIQEYPLGLDLVGLESPGPGFEIFAVNLESSWFISVVFFSYPPRFLFFSSF